MTSIDFVPSGVGRYCIKYYSATRADIMYTDENGTKLVMTKIGDSAVQFTVGGQLVTHRLHKLLYERLYPILCDNYAHGQTIDIDEIRNRFCVGINYNNRYYRGDMKSLRAAYENIVGEFSADVDICAASDAYSMMTVNKKNAMFYDAKQNVVRIGHFRESDRKYHEYAVEDLSGDSEWIINHPLFACSSSIDEIIDEGLDKKSYCIPGTCALIKITELE